MGKTAFIQNHLSSSAFYENLFTRAKKIGTARQIFGTVLIVYPCRDYFQEVVSATLKFWALVPHLMWDRYVYTSKLEVPCLKIVSTVPKIWRAVPIFLARVNGVKLSTVTTLWCLRDCKRRRLSTVTAFWRRSLEIPVEETVRMETSSKSIEAIKRFKQLLEQHYSEPLMDSLKTVSKWFV